MTVDRPAEVGAEDAAANHRCVLFADVCDSSRLYRELGDEPARQLIGASLDMARAAVEAEQGRVVDTIGDEVFCLLPDGNSGLRAAIEIHELMAIERDKGKLPVGLGFRIGLVYGSVVLDEQKVFGDTVYAAKRISSQAKYEQILLDRETYSSLEAPDAERFRLMESLRLKGRVDEIELIEALWGPDVTAEVPGVQPTTVSEVESELVLRFGENRLVVSRREPFVTLGRGDNCNLVVPDARVSRLHARVELVRGEFVWMDQSRNGSVIVPGGGPPRVALRCQVALEGEGRVQLGPDADAPILMFAIRPSEGEP